MVAAVAVGYDGTAGPGRLAGTAVVAGGSAVADGAGVVDGGAGVVDGGAGIVGGTDRVRVGAAVAVEGSVGVEVGPTVGLGSTVGVGSNVGVGSTVRVGVGSGPVEPVGSGSGGSVGSGSDEPVGSGLVGSGSGEPVGPGSVGEAVGGGGATGGGTAGEVPRVGFGAGGRVVPRRAGPRSAVAGSSGERRGAAGSQPLGGTTLGVPGGGSPGWLVIGSGIRTGPTDGVGMKGVLLSGSAVLPGVAEPALIAARIGIDAVPASRATVSR